MCGRRGSAYHIIVTHDVHVCIIVFTEGEAGHMTFFHHAVKSQAPGHGIYGV